MGSTDDGRGVRRCWMTFLSPAELYTLTARKRKSAQIAWLRSRRIRHYVNASGHPVVAREWLDGGGHVPQEPRLHLLGAKA